MREHLKSPLRSKRTHRHGHSTALLAVCAAACLVCALAPAQDLKINSSPNVVGSGARAMGMGGAFIAVADDATAASWNPGGLVQLERPEASLVYEHFWRSEDFGGVDGIPMDSSGDVSLDDLNYASVAYPLPVSPWGRNIVLSLNYQRRYDLNRSLSGTYQQTAGILGTNFINTTRQRFDFKQTGSLNALTPAAAIELTKRLSIGIAVNIYESGLGENGWKTELTNDVHASVNASLAGRLHFNRKEDFKDVSGANVTLGMLWSPTDRLSIGAVYHSPLSLDYRQHTSKGLRQLVPVIGFTHTTLDQRWRAELPAAFGLGIAFHVNDRLTLSLDATRRFWSDAVLVRKHARPAIAGTNRISPITGGPKSGSDVSDVYTVRAGMEYVFADPNRFIQNYLPSLRAGVFYDPEPSRGSPDPVYGVTLGAGVLIHDRVNIDLAYQYRFGNGIRGDTFGVQYGHDLARGDVGQHSILLSTVIYF